MVYQSLLIRAGHFQDVFLRFFGLSVCHDPTRAPPNTKRPLFPGLFGEKNAQSKGSKDGYYLASISSPRP